MKNVKVFIEIANFIKSRTSQNVAVAGAASGVVIAIISNYYPELMQDESLKEAVIIFVNAGLVALTSRIIAFSRNPEKKVKNEIKDSTSI